MLLANPLRTANNFPLRDRVDGIDVVDPFGAFPIALMDCVDAQEPRGALRVRPAPLAYGNGCRSGSGELGSSLPVPGSMAQIVEVGNRNLRQARVLEFAKHLPLPF